MIAYFLALDSTNTVVTDSPSLCISALTTPPGMRSLVQVFIWSDSRVSSATWHVRKSQLLRPSRLPCSA